MNDINIITLYSKSFAGNATRSPALRTCAKENKPYGGVPKQMSAVYYKMIKDILKPIKGHFLHEQKYEY